MKTKLIVFIMASSLFLSCRDRHAAPKNIALHPFHDTTFWHFQKYLGNGEMTILQEQGQEVMCLASQGDSGMAATVHTPSFPVLPGYEYKVTMEIKTQELHTLTARLLGGPYFYFNDKHGHPAGWYPVVALKVGPSAFMAPVNSDWISVTHTIKTPTTAGTARLFLAYAAYGDWEGGYPRNTGRGKGKLWLRNVRITLGQPVRDLPVTIHVSDSTLQAGLNVAAACLHNASLSGQFIVSDGYSISGNIVPDLSFGLFGARRLAHPSYLTMLQEHWKRTAATIDDQGRVTSQRVMSQLFFPLGVDEIFSFTGDKAFLAEYLPLADRTLYYVIQRADSNGLSRLVDYGKWRLGEGADWVDWYPARMEGKTFMFHQWYLRALRRIAALHEEFAAEGIGNLQQAQSYRALADKIEQSLRQLYWSDDHFITNIDFGGKRAEQRWMDDQVWSIRLGVATESQRRKIWNWIDQKPEYFEGVPMRWAAFEGPQHGALSWFGRNGAGDILARYGSGNPQRGYELLLTISRLFKRDENIYEAYTMQGQLAEGTNGWGNYTEHSGGYIWAVFEGPFGIRCESDQLACATIQPQMPDSWSNADLSFYLRGTRIQLVYQKADHSISLSGRGPAQAIRMILPDGKTEIARIGDQPSHTFHW